MTSMTLPGTTMPPTPKMNPALNFPLAAQRQGARKPRLRVRSSGLTDIGLHREQNEDCYVIDDEINLYLVADGMGGGPRGDLASHLAVDTVRELMACRNSKLCTQHLLERAIYSAWVQVCEMTLSFPELSGMGTTLAGLSIDEEGRATVAHVGDSRIYRLQSGALERLTMDHTLVAELVADGTLTEAEAMTHPRRNVLSRALCLDGRCEVEVSTFKAAAGDVFLLCTDGLNSMLGDDEVQFFLETEGTLQSTCHRLIQAALRRGGRDNVTAVLVEVLERA